MKNRDPRIYTEEQVLSVLSHGGTITDGMADSLSIPRLKEMLQRFIPESVFLQAKKMNVNLNREFLKLIFGRENFAELRENLICTSAGVVGTVLANQYYKKLGYIVENEIPIFDQNGQKVSSADIKLTAPNGDETYIELKTSRGVISNYEDYPPSVHPDDTSKPLIPGVTVFPRESFEVRTFTLNNIAMSTGEKAIEQIIKYKQFVDTLNDGKKRLVKLGVFEGTSFSKDIRKSIKKHASIEVIPIDVNKIFDYCTTLVVGTINEGRNMIRPPKGVLTKDVYTIVKDNEKELDLR